MTYELRIYTLDSAESADLYRRIWIKHMTSLERFGIRTAGVFSVANDAAKVVALVKYPESADPDALGARYMASAEFRADMEGFDFARIVSVTTTPLLPESFSPLR